MDGLLQDLFTLGPYVLPSLSFDDPDKRVKHESGQIGAKIGSNGNDDIGFVLGQEGPLLHSHYEQLEVQPHHLLSQVLPQFGVVLRGHRVDGCHVLLDLRGRSNHQQSLQQLQCLVCEV